jgi:hypothetical protein
LFDHINQSINQETTTQLTTNMAWPWGGSVTHAQLAAKFSWPTVIVSMLLLPFLFVWRHVFAFPFFFAWFPCRSILGNRTYYNYPSEEDFMRKEIYFAPTNKCGFPSGFNLLADVEGNKWFESFWGIMHVLDMKTTPDRMTLTENVLSVLPCTIEIKFPKHPVHKHEVDFYFPIGGLYLLNPFMYLTSIPIGTAIGMWAFVSGKAFLAKHDATVVNVPFPPAAEEKKD